MSESSEVKEHVSRGAPPGASVKEPRKLNLNNADEALAEVRELMPDPEDVLAVLFDEDDGAWELFMLSPGAFDPAVIASGKTLDEMIWSLETSSYPQASAARVRTRAKKKALEESPIGKEAARRVEEARLDRERARLDRERARLERERARLERERGESPLGYDEEIEDKAHREEGGHHG